MPEINEMASWCLKVLNLNPDLSTLVELLCLILEDGFLVAIIPVRHDLHLLPSLGWGWGAERFERRIPQD